MTTPTPSSHTYHYLDNLLGAYLNADYTICGPEPEDAVKAYAAAGGPLYAAAARRLGTLVMGSGASIVVNDATGEVEDRQEWGGR